jgi:fimbrial chaperone protein
VTVKNVGAEATVIQLETSSWTQHNGEDVLASTGEVLATPPILTVPPGESRIIRVGLRRQADAQHELTYRLFLREVPPPEPIAQGLRVALLISMPIFVIPPRLPGPEVRWQATRTHDGQIRVRAENVGKSHVQLGQLDITLAGGSATVASRNMAEYVLPDNGRDWAIKGSSAPPVGALLNISSQTDAGKMHGEVKLEDDAREVSPATAPVAAR